MSSRTCADCGKDIQGTRRTRCRECKLLFRAKQAREKYHSTINRVSGQDPRDYEHVDGGAVVDYATNGGFAAPGLAPPVSYRSNPRHDTERWKSQERHQQIGEAEESSMSSWGNLTAPQPDDRRVSFPAPDRGSEFGMRGGREVHQVDDWAAAGQLHRSPGGQRAQQPEGRFGRVEIPQAISAGQLCSPPPNMVAKERAQAEHYQAVSEHARFLLPGRRR